MNSAASHAGEFISSCATGLPGEYRFSREGLVCLYASCYAAMARHFMGGLGQVGPQERAAWCVYINSWQDPETGYYLGPEIAPEECTRPEMDETYVRLHLAAHVLPALAVLSGAPAHPLHFARRFSELGTLRAWLEARDWRRAWLEGNNLLFAGQFLVHLRDHENDSAAQPALDLYFDWLDAQQDPATGLWGTNGYCDLNEALYGAYHQLLVYFYCGRPVRYADRIVDGILSLQQADGSFGRTPGGGACEDVDAVHVLVNLVQRTGYRAADARRALGRTIPHVLRQQASDGGFVYRWGHPYMQSGLLRTFVPADAPDLFSTWFRLHTLGVIAQLLDAPELRHVEWSFNPVCSMGWQDDTSPAPESAELPAGRAQALPRKVQPRRAVRGAAGQAARAVMARIPQARVRSWFVWLLRRYGRAHAPSDQLRLLVGLDAELDRLGRATARTLGGGLDAQFWWTQSYSALLPQVRPGIKLMHLGCGTGSLSFSLASSAGALVTATDRNPALVSAAAERYHHPRLAIVPVEAAAPPAECPDLVLLTDLADGRPAWDAWSAVWASYEGGIVLAQLTPHPTSWRDAIPISSVGGAVQTQDPVGLAPRSWVTLGMEARAGALYGRFRVVLRS